MHLLILNCAFHIINYENENDNDQDQDVRVIVGLQTSVPEQDSAKERIVVIDPGCGGDDPGAVITEGNTEIREKESNLKIALLLQAMLEQSGVRAEITREDDRKVSLEDRMKLAKNLNASLFVSIHNEISEDLSRKGISTQYNSSDNAENYGITGEKAAQLIHATAVKELKSDGGIMAMSGRRLYDSLEMPVVCVSPAFMTNESDRKMIMTEEFRLRAAKVLHDGIIAVLNESK